MNVFISWSGETSHQVALVFRDCLPTINPKVQAWVSSEDISKGKRWFSELMEKLEEISFGIICIDQSNYLSPWLNYEAGAISKSLSESYVAPFLFHVSQSQIIGPLAHFQATTFTKDEIYKLLIGVNDAAHPHSLTEEQLKKALEFIWDTLQNKLSKIRLPESLSQQHSRNNDVGIDADQVFELSSQDIEFLKLLASIKESGDYWVQILQIAKQFKLTENRADYILRRLERHGFINHHMIHGGWGIKDKGIDFLIENEQI